MKVREHIEANQWSGARTVFEDDYGNRGEVRWPRTHNYGLRGYARWYDADVHVNTHAEGSADEIGAYAEFVMQLAHVAKTLDLAFAEDKQEALGRVEREQREAEFRKKVQERSLQMRCEEVAQYYMQMVRVQREGHSSHAKGELHVVVLREGHEDQSIRRQMFLRESNGNRWTFNADQVAKFEVKDGNRYNKVEFTPMDELRAASEREIVKEEAAA